MATGKIGKRGIRDSAIGHSAGIRPFKLDRKYTTTTTFLAAKSARGENSASAEAGDEFYDSTYNVPKYYNGSAWIGEQGVLYKEVSITAAQLIAMNVTAKELVAAPGAGKAIIFHGATVNEHGGTTDYDQNENTTILYHTATTVVSLTLANFFNGATAGSITTIKPLATDVAIAANDALEIKCSASPKNAAGDRLATVRVWYSIIDVTT